MKVKNLAFFGIMASILGVSAASAADPVVLPNNANGILTTKAYVDRGLGTKQDTIDSTHKLPASNVDGLAAVATSGSYNSLTDKPAIPTNSNFVENTINSEHTDMAPSGAAVSTALAGKQATIDAEHPLSASLVDGLATVATTGSYNNLTDKPTAATYVASTIVASDTDKAPSGQAVSSAITTINTALDGKQATINAQNTLSGAYLTDSTVSSAKLDAALSSTINSKLDANSALNGAKLTDGTVSSDKLDTALSSTISGKVTANDALSTYGTKTKITYDAKGLVTAGADLETSDLPVPTKNIDNQNQTCSDTVRCVMTYNGTAWSLTPMSTTIAE